MKKMKKKKLESAPIVNIIAAGLNSGLLRSAAAALVLFASTTALHPVRAEETTTEKVETKVDSAKKKTKKKYRKAKKKLRDATGNESMKEDVKDGLDNAGDEIDYQGKKIKRKAD